jgi:hypothetical protein
MGAYTYINDKKLKFWRVNVVDFSEFESKYNVSVDNIELGRVILAND